MCIRDRERIVLISTHIVSDVEYIAAENAVMKAGKIIAQDTTEGPVPYTHLDVYKRQGLVCSVTAFLFPFCLLHLETRMTVCMGYTAMTPQGRAGKRRRKRAGNPCRENGRTLISQLR